MRIFFIGVFIFGLSYGRLNIGIIDAIDHQIKKLKEKVEEKKAELDHHSSITDKSGRAGVTLPSGRRLALNIYDEEILNFPIAGINVYFISDFWGKKKGYFLFDTGGEYPPLISDSFSDVYLPYLPSFSWVSEPFLVSSSRLFDDVCKYIFYNFFFILSYPKVEELKKGTEFWDEVKLKISKYPAEKVAVFLVIDLDGPEACITIYILNKELLGTDDFFYEFYRNIGLGDDDYLELWTSFYGEVGEGMISGGIASIALITFPTIKEKRGTLQIIGSVNDQSANPIENVKIYLNPPTWKESTSTNSNGEFSFFDVANISYTITLIKPGYKRGWREVFPSDSSLSFTLKPANNPPYISSFTAVPEVIFANQRSNLSCFAYDPDGELLTYQWIPEDGSIYGSGSEVEWIPPSSAGKYEIKVKVYDNDYRYAEDSITIEVLSNNSPTIEKLQPTRTEISPGSTTTIICEANDLDNDLLTYHWSCPSGEFIGGGGEIVWKAPNDEGKYTITCEVYDGKGGKDTSTTTVTVEYWTIRIVDYDGDVGKYSSITINKEGNPIISYHDTTNSVVKCAIWDGKSWIKETIDTGFESSVFYDKEGGIHISYFSGNSICYANYNNLKWVTKTDLDVTTSPVGGYNSIICDANLYPKISYYDEANGDLKYIYWDGNQWNIELIDSSGDVGRGSSISLDPNGQPRIGYYDVTNKDPKLARYISGSWSIETVSAIGDVGLSPSYKIDKLGRDIIAYINEDDGTIEVAFYDGSWIIETATGGVNISDYSLDLDLTPDGRPFIVYYSTPTKDVIYVLKKPDGSWESKIIDSEGDVGKNPSVVIDANGLAHVSYYDWRNEMLKYARQNP